MTSMPDRIPCKYTVVKFVPDLMRDEPVNVGIILQSQVDFETRFKSIADISISKNIAY